MHLLGRSTEVLIIERYFWDGSVDWQVLHPVLALLLDFAKVRALRLRYDAGLNETRCRLHLRVLV